MSQTRSNSNDYVIEKLANTIDCLATHPGDARARVRDCYLSFHTLNESDFPDDLRADWRWIIKTMTRCEPTLDYKGDVLRGSVETTMRASRNATAAKVAERLWKLYWAVSANSLYE